MRTLKTTKTMKTMKTMKAFNTVSTLKSLKILRALRISVTIFILSYCLFALGDLSSICKIKLDFSIHSRLSDHSGRSGLPTQSELTGQLECLQQIRKTPLESDVFVSIQKYGQTQKATITSHDEMVPMDLSCLDCNVRQLDPFATQRSPKNDFFFC